MPLGDNVYISRSCCNLSPIAFIPKPHQPTSHIFSPIFHVSVLPRRDNTSKSHCISLNMWGGALQKVLNIISSSTSTNWWPRFCLGFFFLLSSLQKKTVYNWQGIWKIRFGWKTSAAEFLLFVLAGEFHCGFEDGNIWLRLCMSMAPAAPRCCLCHPAGCGVGVQPLCFALSLGLPLAAAVAVPLLRMIFAKLAHRWLLAWILLLLLLPKPSPG